VRERENNIKLKWFSLLMNSGSSEQERHCSKAKKFIWFVEIDAGGFWGFFSKLLGFLRFGSSDKNALRAFPAHFTSVFYFTSSKTTFLV
jgi:hypothetical protein